ncbi:hypothetical protein B5G42_01030 [Flavonifractor sp. An91]|nr:hypothetical protein B5G42_01030 [Flavonifractor sp. An91]
MTGKSAKLRLMLSAMYQTILCLTRWFQISALHNMKKRLQTFLRNIIQKPYELQKLENLLFMSTLMF